MCVQIGHGEKKISVQIQKSVSKRIMKFLGEKSILTPKRLTPMCARTKPSLVVNICNNCVSIIERILHV